MTGRWSLRPADKKLARWGKEHHQWLIWSVFCGRQEAKYSWQVVKPQDSSSNNESWVMNNDNNHLLTGRLLRNTKRQSLRWSVSRMQVEHLTWTFETWERKRLPHCYCQRMNTATPWNHRRPCKRWQRRSKRPWRTWTQWSTPSLICSGVMKTWRAPWRALRK